MAKIDYEFKEICQAVIDNGKEYTDHRRDVTRLQIPSYTFRHNFEDGFPALTLKDLYWKGIVGELIWFLRGDNNVKYLNDNGIQIWNKDAYNWYVKQVTPLFKNTDVPILTLKEIQEKGFNVHHFGSVGQNYSAQWRNFNGDTDQIQNMLNDMAKNIMGSRIKVNAWNPSETDETALPPCHSEFQIIGVPLENGEFGFELHWNQRSVDIFLGLPFNIASYGLLAKIIEKITGFKALAIEGTLKCVHFYDNQYKKQEGQEKSALDILMERDCDEHPNCEVEIEEKDIPTESKNNIDYWMENFSIQDFTLKGYSGHPKIPVEMLAPKEL